MRQAAKIGRPKSQKASSTMIRCWTVSFIGLTKKAEPPPTRSVNRDSGTDSANGGWLRRLVRRLVSHTKSLLVQNIRHCGHYASYNTNNDKPTDNSTDANECVEILILGAGSNPTNKISKASDKCTEEWSGNIRVIIILAITKSREASSREKSIKDDAPPW